MIRSRALRIAVVACAALVAAGALHTISGRFAEHASMGSPQTEGPIGSPLPIVVESDPGGAIVFWAGRSGNTGDVRAFAADGSLLWQAEGVEDVIPAGRSEAIVTRRAPGGNDGVGAETSMWRVGRDGFEQELSRSSGLLRPVFADSTEVVYVETVYDETGSAQSIIAACDGVRTKAVSIPGGGETVGIGVSADGTALVVTTAVDADRLLSWFSRDPGEGWRLVAQGPTSADYVALSPDGKQAVLGLSPPCIVSFGGTRGSPLPVAYVSDASFGYSRLYLLHLRVESNVLRTTVTVVNLPSCEIAWSQEFEGEHRVAHDPAVARLAFLAPGRRAVTVTDVVHGVEKQLPVEYAGDLGFIDSEHLLLARQDRSVEILSIGGDG